MAASMAASAQAAPADRSGRRALIATLAPLVVGAAVLWTASRMTWVHATIEADHLGTIERSLNGSSWAPELTAIALGIVAIAAVLCFSRARVTRIVAGLAAVLGIVALVSVVQLVAGGPEATRIHSIVTAGADVARTAGGGGSGGVDRVPQWAVVTDSRAVLTGPSVAALGVVLILGGAAVGVTKPRPAQARGDRYQTPAALRAAATQHEAGEAQPGAGMTHRGADDNEVGAGSQDGDRLLWDSLDAGEDPTDR